MPHRADAGRVADLEHVVGRPAPRGCAPARARSRRTCRPGVSTRLAHGGDLVALGRARPRRSTTSALPVASGPQRRRRARSCTQSRVRRAARRARCPEVSVRRPLDDAHRARDPRALGRQRGRLVRVGPLVADREREVVGGRGAGAAAGAPALRRARSRRRGERGDGERARALDRGRHLSADAVGATAAPRGARGEVGERLARGPADAPRRGGRPRASAGSPPPPGPRGRR